MKRICLAVTLAALALPAAAQAKWGPGEHCELWANHCYAIQAVPGWHQGSVAYENTIAAGGTGGSKSFAFVTNEHWVLFNVGVGAAALEWVETGNMYTAGPGRLTQFIAAKIGPNFYERIEPTTVPMGSYNSTLIYDRCLCGQWEIYTGFYGPGAGWKRQLGTYGGLPVYSYWQEAGMEMAAETEMYNVGKQMVATADGLTGPGLDGGAWGSWDGAKSTGDLPQWGNPDSNAPGNIEWGTPPIAPTGTAVVKPRAQGSPGKMVLTTGKALKAQMASVPPGSSRPAGTYRAVIKSTTGVTEAEYVGSHAPTEAEVRRGGTL